MRRVKGRLIWIVAGVVLLAVAGFVAYRVFLVEPPPPPPVAKKPAPTQPAQNQPPSPATTAPMVPLPGQELIDAGQDAINAKRAKEQARVDALAAGENPPEKPAPVQPPPKPAAPTPTAATATTTLAPGVSATSTSVLVTGPASAAFRSFVANSKIGGVRPGTPARALINGGLYRAGDVVNSSLGVRFDSVDAEARTITFRDETGAVVTRKY